MGAPALLFSEETSGSEMPNTPLAGLKTVQEIKNKFSCNLQLAVEFLNYTETDMELTPAQHSKSDSMNIVSHINAVYKTNHLRIGINSTLPIVIGQGEEKWTRYQDNFTFQKDKLNYYWERIDTYLGYSFGKIAENTFYAGIRASEGIQRRTDFISFGVPITGTSTEKIYSTGQIYGYSGERAITPFFSVNWGAELCLPINSRVTNSGMPGIVFKNKNRNAYTTKVKTGVTYKKNDKISFSFEIYGGKMIWEGSKVKTIRTYDPLGDYDTYYKWPRNETNYTGISFGLRYSF